MKGILLAGGTGSRLFPATLSCSKQMLPVYDKPMIYYPLSVLMLAGIKDILIISTPRDIGAFEALLHDGSDLGIHLSYKAQEAPKGIGQAFLLGEDFIGKDSVCLILGDNIFYGNSLSKMVQASANLKRGCELYATEVPDPENFGIACEKNGKVFKIEEKPKNPTSNLAVTGLYFYDNDVVKIAKTIKPSARGELEITSINNKYIENKRCKINKLSRGFAWLDTGTQEGLFNASQFIHSVQKMTGTYIACIEEVAYRMGFIDKNKLLQASEKCKNTDYGVYLRTLYEQEK